MKIYCYWIDRHKLEISQSKLKKELYLISNLCYLCLKEYSIGNLELEHKVPVMLGGNIIDKSNLGLVCSKCHKKKTKIDIKIIGSLKKLGIITKSCNGIDSLLNLKELEQYYLKFYPLVSQGIELERNWDIEVDKIYLKDNQVKIKKGEDGNGFSGTNAM